MLIDGVRLELTIPDLNFNGEDGIDLMKFLCRNQAQVPIPLFTGLKPDEHNVRGMPQQDADQYPRQRPLERLCKAVGAAVAGSRTGPPA
jgi:DNA-binding response OmpR family regulator